MRFEVGKKYKFTYDSGLRDSIRGKVFIPIYVVENEPLRIQIFDDNGELMISPDGRDFWYGDPPNSARWEKYNMPVWGKSVLEFKFV